MLLGGDHFLLCHRHCVKERLHRRFAEAPAPLMWPRLVVFADPYIKTSRSGLQLVFFSNPSRQAHAAAQAPKLRGIGTFVEDKGLFIHRALITRLRPQLQVEVRASLDSRT